MKFCSNCGTSFEDGAKFCPNCGTSCSPTEQPATAVVVPEIIETNPEKKVLAAFAYCTIFVWIYLLIFKKDDAFLRHHSNQALVALIFTAGGCIIPYLGWILILPATLVFEIIALIGAIKGKYRKMPLIGNIRILK